AHADADLGRQHDVLALRHLHERGAHDLLGPAGIVGVCRVEEGDADIQRALEVGRRLGLVELAPAAAALGAPRIAAEADAADDQARAAQRSVFHRKIPLVVRTLPTHLGSMKVLIEYCGARGYKPQPPRAW